MLITQTASTTRCCAFFILICVLEAFSTSFSHTLPANFERLDLSTKPLLLGALAKVEQKVINLSSNYTCNERSHEQHEHLKMFIIHHIQVAFSRQTGEAYPTDRPARPPTKLRRHAFCAVRYRHSFIHSVVHAIILIVVRFILSTQQQQQPSVDRRRNVQ